MKDERVKNEPKTKRIFFFLCCLFLIFLDYFRTQVIVWGKPFCRKKGSYNREDL